MPKKKKKQEKKTKPDEKAPTILGPKVGFTDLLDLAIERKLKNEREAMRTGKLKRFPLRPSSAGQCSRLLALQLMEYRGLDFFEGAPTLQPNIYRLFELGHSIEWRALRTFGLLNIAQRYKQQIVELFEITTKDGPRMIEGSCDFVFWSEKYKCLGDVKSKKDGWSAFYRSKWEEELEKFSAMKSLTKLSPTAFYADSLAIFLKELNQDWICDNLYQINLYATSDFMQKRGIDFAFIYRYNKNSSEHMEIRFRPSNVVAEQTKRKFQNISDAVEHKVIDDMVCDFPVGSMRYAFCDCHKYKPYANKGPLKSWYATLPKKKWPKDIDRLDASVKLRALFKAYLKGNEMVKAEEEIISILLEIKTPKIRLDNGWVFELKYLKSPRPHYELRRSKV